MTNVKCQSKLYVQVLGVAKMNLILIEGLPGMGKTSTAKAIHENISLKGETCEVFFETSMDCPVAYPWSFEQARQIISGTTLAHYPFDSWKNLSNCQNIVIESKFLQNTALFSKLQDCSFSTMVEFPLKILKIVQSSKNCTLVYLKCSDVVSHLDQCIKIRNESTPTWLPFVSELFSEQSWCKQRNLTSRAAFVDTLVSWQDDLNSIVKQLDCKVIELVDPSVAWDESLNQVFEELKETI